MGYVALALIREHGMSNKTLLEILEKIEAIHNKKAQDYTTDTEVDPYENFARAAIVGSWFPTASTHCSFAVLIGTKLARLGALLTKGGTPNNESIADTFLDLCTYCVLWYSYYQDSTKDTKALWPRVETVPTSSSSDYFHSPPKILPPQPIISEPVDPDKLDFDKLVETVRIGGDKTCKHEVVHNWRDSDMGKCFDCEELIDENTMLKNYRYDPRKQHYVKK